MNLFFSRSGMVLGIVALTISMGMALGQQPNPPTAGIGFRNELNSPILIQGASVVNGMLRRGQPFVVMPGKVGWDTNLPPVTRQVMIFDHQQPTKILYREPPIPFQGKDLLFAVRPIPKSPDKVTIISLPMPPNPKDKQ